MSTAAPDARTAPPRYHELDALRAAMMFMGIFVHTATLSDDAVFNGVSYASGLFRMNAFFVVAGFFAAMLVGRYGATEMIRRRLLVLGVPLAAVLALINPVHLWVMYNHFNPHIGFIPYLRGDGVDPPDGPLIWHLHLWFLISLLVYTLLTPALAAALARTSHTAAYRWLVASRPRALALLFGFLIVTTLVLKGIYQVVLEPVVGPTPFGFLFEVTLRYLPFFTIGLAIFLDRPRLLPVFRRPTLVPLAVTGVLLYAGETGRAGALASGAGNVLVNSVFALAVVVNLFALFSRLFARARPAARYAADAAYTVYLFHYFAIYLIATVLSVGTDAGFGMLLLVSVLTFAVTLAVHHFLIRRFRLLAKVFNGKFTFGRHARRTPLRPASAPASGAPAPAPTISGPSTPVTPPPTGREHPRPPVPGGPPPVRSGGRHAMRSSMAARGRARNRGWLGGWAGRGVRSRWRGAAG
ncbi:MAG: acyltransferase family protein [Frankia sp.]|nr:acyltransferase family protein [Frankia sp.]